MSDFAARRHFLFGYSEMESENNVGCVLVFLREGLIVEKSIGFIRS